MEGEDNHHTCMVTHVHTVTIYKIFHLYLVRRHGPIITTISKAEALRQSEKLKQAWWCVPVVLALGSQRLEELCGFVVSSDNPELYCETFSNKKVAVGRVLNMSGVLGSTPTAGKREKDPGILLTPVALGLAES